LAFTRADFEDLAKLGDPADVAARFWPKVEELLVRVNQLQCMRDVQITRSRAPGPAFEVQQTRMRVRAYHWYVFNVGGREEAQFKIGMDVRYLRMGLGFNAELTPGRGSRFTPYRVARAFDAFREAVSRRPYAFHQLALREDLRVEGHEAETDDPMKLVAWLRSADVKAEKWVFLGSFLRPDNPADLLVLGDWDRLLRKIERVFDGLYPFWQFSNCQKAHSERLRAALDLPEDTPDRPIDDYWAEILKCLEEARKCSATDSTDSRPVQ
ncbi:MAG: hypothetical protein AB1609_19305, partial [Bacillota bacterium]